MTHDTQHRYDLARDIAAIALFLGVEYDDPLRITVQRNYVLSARVIAHVVIVAETRALRRRIRNRAEELFRALGY